MRVLGVDPGAYGALALVHSGNLVLIHDMPILKVRRGKNDKAEVDGYTLTKIVMELCPDVAYVEQVGGFTGQSASSAFNFGRAAGAVEYTLKALGVRVELVPPNTWRRALKVNPGKDGSRAMAMGTWPDRSDWFARKKDDGRAEAALIAEWGWRQQRGAGSVFS